VTTAFNLVGYSLLGFLESQHIDVVIETCRKRRALLIVAAEQGGDVGVAW